MVVLEDGIACKSNTGHQYLIATAVNSKSEVMLVYVCDIMARNEFDSAQRYASEV